jgi:bifunctional DNase/RNase
VRSLSFVCLAACALSLVACAAQTRPVALSIPAQDPAAIATAPEPAVAAAKAPPVPDGYVTMTVFGVGPQGAGGVIALLDPTGATVVPIYVGGTEAASATHRFHGTRPERPLTHDLMDALMRHLGAELVRAQVDTLENGTYIGSIVVEQKGRFIELDARPSDAIALAMGAKVPIVMAAAVVKKAGVPKDGFQDLDDSLSGAPIFPPAGASGEPIECAKARLLKRLGRSEWAQAAAICVSKGGKP